MTRVDDMVNPRIEAVHINREKKDAFTPFKDERMSI